MTENTLKFDGHTYQNIHFRQTIINFSHLAASKNNFQNLASKLIIMTYDYYDYGDITKILKTLCRISLCIMSFLIKTNISYPLIRTHKCAYQEVRNVSFN